MVSCASIQLQLILLECTHEWIVGLSRGNNIDVDYFDFSKAFDSIVFPSC